MNLLLIQPSCISVCVLRVGVMTSTQAAHSSLMCEYKAQNTPRRKDQAHFQKGIVALALKCTDVFETVPNCLFKGEILLGLIIRPTCGETTPTISNSALAQTTRNYHRIAKQLLHSEELFKRIMQL